MAYPDTLLWALDFQIWKWGIENVQVKKPQSLLLSPRFSWVFLINAQQSGANFQILKMLILTIFATFFVLAVTFMEETIFKVNTMPFSQTSEDKLIFVLILYSVF